MAQFSYSENPVWENIKDQIKSLIAEILVANPAQRLTAKEVLKNQWIMMGY